MLRAVVPGEITQLGPREVEIRMMTGALARDGHIVEPAGVVIDNYLKNPIQLWQHNPEFPVGCNRDLRVEDGSIVARTVFAPAGVSAKADEICGLVKNGIVRSVSIGFDALDAEPLDPKLGARGGLRITRWELLECSFVSIPADPGALVTARDLDGAGSRADEADWKCGAARDLPIEDSDSWDGAEAEASIFEHAAKLSHSDDFDPDKAKRGFLVYNAAKPKLRGSYKLPIARVVGGELKVPKGAIRAAASRLPQADIPEAIKDTAGAVLDHYKKKAGIDADQKTADGEAERSDDGTETSRAAVIATRREIARAALNARGMYGVANLAWLLDDLADAVKLQEFEEAIEEDGSALAAQLKAQLAGLGAVLVAMTQEEVAELVAGGDTDPGMMGLGMMMFTTSPGLTRQLSAGLQMRAGKALSAANAAKLQEADGHHEKALAHHADAVECHRSMGERCDGMRAAHEKAMDAHAKLGEALAAGDLDAARKHHAALKRNMDAIADHNEGLGDAHEAMGDAHRGIARCVRAAQRCVRAVATPGIGHPDADEDSQTVQTSAGVGKSGGAADDRAAADYRRRQVAKLRLAAA